MLMNKRYLSWSEFDQAVEGLGELYYQAWRIKPGKPKAQGIVGQPRGGLPLAVALSHLLDLPVMNSLPYRGRAIWVDDIFDSNHTYILAQCQAEEHETEIFPMAWFSRYEPPPEAHYVERLDSDIWLVFPWERWSDPDTEMARYQAHLPRTVP